MISDLDCGMKKKLFKKSNICPNFHIQMVIRNYYHFFIGVEIIMDTNMITYLACICFIFIFGKIFILPLKKILKLIVNSVLGGICIYIINLIGSTFGFHIGLNFFTSIVIRIIRLARCSLSYCCKVVNRIKGVEIIAIYVKLLYNHNNTVKTVKRKERIMAKRRIIIVDDDANNKKCEAMRGLIKEFGMQYDVALTLEEAAEKMFSLQGIQYDAVILDRSFPKTKGERATGEAGDLLLAMMERRNQEIPVLIYSIVTSMPESQLVANRISPWDLEGLMHFLNYVKR